MKEATELQVYCDNAQTFDQSMECMRMAFEFAEKWQVPQPQILQFVNYDQLVDSEAVEECFQEAYTIAEYNICMDLKDAYLEKYNLALPAFMQSLQTYGPEFAALEDVFNCYFRAMTPADIEKCNELAAQIESS